MFEEKGQVLQRQLLLVLTFAHHVVILGSLRGELLATKQADEGAGVCLRLGGGASAFCDWTGEGLVRLLGGVNVAGGKHTRVVGDDILSVHVLGRGLVLTGA